MIGINDLVEELIDDVYIRGIGPSQPFKPMTNKEVNVDQELTSDVLKEIAGGPHIRDFGIGFTQSLFGFSRSNQRKGIIHPNYIIDPVHKVGFDVGSIGRRV